MTAKTSKAKRDAFLRAVAETGNQTLAAERAKVSLSWVQLHRSTDPAFRAAVAAAVATAKARLAMGQIVPPGGWRTQAGEELIVRASNGRRVQVARARLKQWTPRIEQRFLNALAGCCNVKTSCATAGMSVMSAYAHRARWPDFMQRWDEALATGYVLLECSMVAQAGRLLDPEWTQEQDLEPDIPLEPMTMHDALQALRLHRFRVRHIGKPLRRPGLGDADTAKAMVMKNIERVERVMAFQAARAKRKQAGDG